MGANSVTSNSREGEKRGTRYLAIVTRNCCCASGCPSQSEDRSPAPPVSPNRRSIELISGGETPITLAFLLRRMYITRGDLPHQKKIFCLATLLSRLLMHGSAVRGHRLIDTPRCGARDLSCLHGRNCAARKVRASASEVKGGGGYGHPLTHGPVF